MNEFEAMALAAAARKRKQEAAAQMTAGGTQSQPQSSADDFEAKRKKLRLLQMQARARLKAEAKHGTQPANERSLGDTLCDNIVGRDDGLNSYGEKLGTFLNKTGESFAFGYIGDETSAAAESLLPRVDFEQRRDHYRQQEQQFEEQHPIA